jgi:multidrug resistance protein, MATE family
VVRTVSLALLFQSVGIVWLNAITGTGNSRINLLIELIALVLYTAYVWYVFEVRDWSIAIGWISEWIYWLSILILSLAYMLSGRWQGKRI